MVLFDPNTALASEMADIGSALLLRWRDEEGRLFTGQYFPGKRIGDDPPPLFVTYYRCTGFLRGGVGDEWPLVSLAGYGISTLCINAAPYRLDAVERYNIGLSAVRSAVTLLASDGEIDGRKIGMGGLSFGSEVTLWAVINSGLLAAASVSSPVISQQYYLLGSIKGEAFLSGLSEYWQLGALGGETEDRWKRVSPALNLHKIKCPILMQLPEQEYMSSLDYMIPLVRDRRADVYVFPNEPHQKFQPRHKLAVYERNLDWFRFWLQGVEATDAAKKEQFARWEIMKARSSAECFSEYAQAKR